MAQNAETDQHPQQNRLGPGEREHGRRQSWLGRLKALAAGRNGESNVRDVLEELIEEHAESETPLDIDGRRLIDNILRVGTVTAYDVMVPRADIDPVEIGTSLSEIVALVTRQPHSRYPVYRDTLDEVLGFIHIKDVLKATNDPGDGFSIRNYLRRPLFVAPSMRVLDLLMQMRMTRTHMALVVDEYGGIDGLITIEDLVEEIVGEIEDEHDVDPGPQIMEGTDGSYVSDARLELDELEKRFGSLFEREREEEDIDTVGGLVATLAGRVPARGELIRHDGSGIEFEVLDADPRRIKKLRLRNLPHQPLKP